MFPFKWRLWRFAWTHHADCATSTDFQARGGVVVARARRVCLGLWWFTLLPKEVR